MPDFKLLERIASWSGADIMLLFVLALLMSVVFLMIRSRAIREYDLFSKRIDERLKGKFCESRATAKFQKINSAFEKVNILCEDRYKELSDKCIEMKALNSNDREKLIGLESKILEHEIETKTKIKSIESNIAIMQPMLQKISEQINQIWGRLSSDKDKD